jgi:hypothetical protein
MISTFRGCAIIFFVHAVSMIPNAWCMRYHWHCMQYHWYHMHRICGVINIACMVHAGNWHRMPKKMYEQLWKVKIICKTAMVCKLKMNAMTLHARCMQCHRHRTHRAWCGINDTACRIFAKSFVKAKNFAKIKKHFRFNPIQTPFPDIYIVAFVINTNRT